MFITAGLSTKLFACVSITAVSFFCKAVRRGGRQAPTSRFLPCRVRVGPDGPCGPSRAGLLVSPKRAKRSEGRVVGESEELMKEGDILILRDCFRGARRPRPPVVHAPMPRPRLLLPRPPGACDSRHHPSECAPRYGNQTPPAPGGRGSSRRGRGIGGQSGNPGRRRRAATPPAQRDCVEAVR